MMRVLLWLSLVSMTTAPFLVPIEARAAQRRGQAAARSGMAITVTNPAGATLAGIQVTVIGPTDRMDETNASGQVNFTAMQAGTYRLRFTGDEVIAFEREATLRAGQVATIDVTLNAAPAVAAEPSAAAAAPAPLIGPSGQPLTLSVPDVLEQNYVGSEPRRETVIACSGNTRTTMIQLNEPLPPRLYDAADAVYYVIGGEGIVSIAGAETPLETNGFVSVPRGTAHAFVRSGRRPLILLAVLSGEPCEVPR